jgi:hypothetical protein
VPSLSLSLSLSLSKGQWHCDYPLGLWLSVTTYESAPENPTALTTTYWTRAFINPQNDIMSLSEKSRVPSGGHQKHLCINKSKIPGFSKITPACGFERIRLTYKQKNVINGQ